MNYYAHTAEDENGTPLPEGHWQPLKDHLRNVAHMARTFGNQLDLGREAEIAGFLHDLGKYRQEFQEYLRGKRPGGPETQHAVFGAAWAFERAVKENKLFGATFAVAGHHAGLHNQSDLEAHIESPALRPLESSHELLRLLKSEHGALPEIAGPPCWVRDEFSAEVYARLVLSCLVDADRLDTASWPQSPSVEKPVDAGRLLELVIAERDRKSADKPDGVLKNLRNLVFNACLEQAHVP